MDKLPKEGQEVLAKGYLYTDLSMNAKRKLETIALVRFRGENYQDAKEGQYFDEDDVKFEQKRTEWQLKHYCYYNMWLENVTEWWEIDTLTKIKNNDKQ